MKTHLILLVTLALMNPVLAHSDSAREKAEQVIAAAIEAMGGDAYLNVNSYHSSGMYFSFDRDRKSWAKYWDWVVYDPVKYRLQFDEGRRQFVSIYNLETGKGWTLQGRTTVEPIPEEDIERFREAVKEDVHLLLRKRRHEEGMNLFYYGPQDVAGSGEYEAVEFLDSTNKSVVVFFELKTRLPQKIEYSSTDRLGLRHKFEVEHFNWHRIQGVLAPLRIDVHRDGELWRQRHMESLTFNPSIPADHFDEPKVDRKR